MVTRVTLTLDPVDVTLIDRLAALQGINRSEQVRELLANARPMLRQTVETLEAALRQRDQLLQSFADAELVGLSALGEELERVQGAVLGSMARIEGALAVQESRDPRGSNHGGHTPTPPYEGSTE